MGAKVLEANGFDVWFYDLSPIVYPALWQGGVYPDNSELKNHRVFVNRQSARKAISELKEDSFAVVVGVYHRASFIIYKSLSKNHIPYAVLATNAVPTLSSAGRRTVLVKLKTFVMKLLRLNLYKLSNIFFKPALAPLWGIRSPVLCIAGGQRSLDIYRKLSLVSESTKILWAHTLDYDQYLDSKNSKNHSRKKTAVFIDLGAPMFVGDQLLPSGMTHLTVDRYYSSLRKFFDYVESECGVDVLIAAHPKSKHPTHPEYFGGRYTERGRTLEMIQGSEFVISHASTALNFVVISKKPMLFITTAEYEADKLYSMHLQTVAASLGKGVINIDAELNVNWDQEFKINEASYSQYKESYIKKSGAEELNTWQILSNSLKRLDHEEVEGW